MNARNIYERGGHSSAAAVLTLIDLPAPRSYPRGTQVFGLTKAHRRPVRGTLMNQIQWKNQASNETVMVKYDHFNGSDSQLVCHVGGLYTFESANLDGCKDSNQDHVMYLSFVGLTQLSIPRFPRRNWRSGVRAPW